MDDDAERAGSWPSDPFGRAAAVAAHGLSEGPLPRGAVPLAALVAADPDGRVRAAALGALVRRADPVAPAAWLGALA
ncbi:MAG: hypothetical protein ACRDY7_09745, partial [Acidimicrobiia bacterium]